ncbi:hypothetical protein KUV28_17620 [Ferrimonas balearica]|nr:hypothetical protein [Ferrimonas balearica]
MNRSLHQAARILQAHWFPAGTVNPDLLDHLKDADFNSHPADIGVALALESLIEATQPQQSASNTQGDFMSTVDSTSNERTTNNAVRHNYRVLTEAEKQQMQQIKDMGAAFITKLHEIGGTDPAGDRFASRDLSLANTHAEDAVIYLQAIKTIQSAAKPVEPIEDGKAEGDLT